MIQAVVFDMDGVLFDTERLYNEAWHEVAESWPIKVNLDDLIVRCVGLNHADTRRLFDDMLGEDFPFDAYTGRIGARFRELVEEELPVKEGVREILFWLKEQKVPTALATSTSRESALSHLRRTGILSYFDEIITGDMVEHSKPAPDIYLIACNALHIPPADCIAVEDSPNGIRSAYAAGMKAVMVPDQIAPTDELRAMLYREFPSLTGLLRYLKEQQD